MLKHLLLMIWCFGVAPKANAFTCPQAATPDTLLSSVDKAAQQFVQQPGHHGLSIGIVKNGRQFTFNFGSLEPGKMVRPTDSTIYEIASVTKSFTGILLAQAIHSKKLGVNDDVRRYLPAGLSNLSYQGHPVTIKDLATHTSGLPKFIPGLLKELSPQLMMQHYDGFSDAQFLDSLSKLKLKTRPGQEFIYSNADAQLIGIILERVYHDSFENLLKRYITGPMQMTDTRLALSGDEAGRLANGYDQKNGIMPTLLWWKNIPAAGFIKSTVKDMLKYIKLNLDENNPMIALSHRSLATVTEEGADSIGLFWFIKRLGNNRRIIFHAGGSFGTTSYCEVRPESKSGIVLLANDARPGTEAELKKMAAKFLTILD